MRMGLTLFRLWSKKWFHAATYTLSLHTHTDKGVLHFTLVSQCYLTWRSHHFCNKRPVSTCLDISDISTSSSANLTLNTCSSMHKWVCVWICNLFSHLNSILSLTFFRYYSTSACSQHLLHTDVFLFFSNPVYNRCAKVTFAMLDLSCSSPFLYISSHAAAVPATQLICLCCYR